MKTSRIGGAALSCAVGLLMARGAQAQWAVIDVDALVQLTQQAATLEQQVEKTESVLQTARSELQQAQSQYQALTGPRGMENLLSGVVRNYLPDNATDLMNVLQGGGGNPVLTGLVQAASQAGIVLDSGRMSLLSPQVQQRLKSARDTAALLQGLSGSALSNSSARFADLQQLISAIGTASDPKAVMDLQARIAAEQGMLQNEQTKLQILNQSLEAQRWSQQQRSREQVVAEHGNFSTRFQPTP